MTRHSLIVTKADYIATVSSYGRRDLLRYLHRLGLKQGAKRFTTQELAELLWIHTAESRARSRASWEAMRAETPVTR